MEVKIILKYNQLENLNIKGSYIVDPPGFVSKSLFSQQSHDSSTIVPIPRRDSGSRFALKTSFLEGSLFEITRSISPPFFRKACVAISISLLEGNPFLDLDFLTFFMNC